MVKPGNILMREKIISLFISDTHIGVRHNNTKKLLEILDHYEFENLFLVGDIIDMTAMKKGVFWKKHYGDIVKKIIKLSKKSRIVYIIGNHDFYLRSTSPQNCFICEIVDEYVYRDILIIHGDKFDTLMYNRKYLYMLGDFGYSAVIWLDKIFGFKGKLSKGAKKLVKNTSNYLGNFYKTAEAYTISKSCGRIVCGHTHIQEYKKMKIEYYNCGDFRESCGYIVEDINGNLCLKSV